MILSVQIAKFVVDMSHMLQRWEGDVFDDVEHNMHWQGIHVYWDLEIDRMAASRLFNRDSSRIFLLWRAGKA